MFNDLFIKMQTKLNDNAIDDVSSVKEYADYMVKKTFKNMFPEEGINMGNVKELMKEGSKKLAELYDADSKEVFETLTRELDDLIPNWENYIDINNLQNAIADSFVNRFFKEKYDDVPDEKTASSFDDAVRNTISRNIEFGYKMESKEDAKKFLSKLFHEFFDKNNIYSFTSRYGSRKYVSTQSKERLLQEMMKTAKMDSSLPAEELESEIRENYIKSVVDSMNF